MIYMNLDQFFELIPKIMLILINRLGLFKYKHILKNKKFNQSYVAKSTVTVSLLFLCIVISFVF